MKTFVKKIIAVGVLLCVAMSGVIGCSNTQQNSSSSTEEGVLQIPFKIEDGNETNLEDVNSDLNNEDPTASASTTASGANGNAASTTTTVAVEDTTSIITVTNAEGQPVTEYIKVTDASGAVVTDAKGDTVTSVAYVTSIVRNTSANNNTTTQAAGNSSSTTQAAEGTQAIVTNPVNTGSDYTPSVKSKYAMWLDISKDENFHFEGDFVDIKFKVKDGIPDGDYKIRISPDLSDIAGKTVSPGKVVDGLIRVNNGTVEAFDASSETTNNVYYGDQISCKQGDTFDFHISVKNNTGIAAFMMWFYYDTNAFEIVETGPSGEFADIANSTEFGSPKNEG